MALENIHLTLAFIGPVDTSMRTCLEQVAARVKGKPFSMTFDQLGYWGRPRVRWAGCSEVPVELQQLAGHLNRELMTCGYKPEQRAFVPHVTIMRKSRALREEIECTPITWQVDDFCLVQSLTHQQGVEYRVVGRWPLAGG